MRKLTSKEEQKKKEKRNKVLLGTILVFVMFGSVFGIVVNSFGSSNSGKEEIIYKGQEFERINNYYVFKIGDYSFYFLSDPRDFLEIDSEVNLSKSLASLNGRVLYLSSEDSYSSQEIYQNLYSYVERIQLACLEGETCEDESLPLKTCQDNLIIIKQSESNKIYEKENCIFVEGKQEDLIKLTDELLLRLIGFN